MKILLATGASGGHIFPALSLIDKLKEKFKVLLLLPQNTIFDSTVFSGYELKYLAITKMGRGFGRQQISSWWGFLKGALQSAIILCQFRPDAVVGFGSLASIPVVVFAWFFRISTLIHEQNVLPGQANRFLAFFADKIAISFPQSRQYFKNYKSKLVFTGNPLRQGLVQVGKNEALDFFGFAGERLTVLVMGGSQASQRINAGFTRAVSRITAKAKIQVIHLAGSRDRDWVSDSYKSLGIPAKVLDFLQPMQYAYSAADLVISRAGATAIAEMVFFQVPAVLIPYPYAYRHQLKNAEVLTAAGCALMIADENLEAGKLEETIDAFLGNPDRLKLMRLNFRKLELSAGQDVLFQEVVSLAGYPYN